MFCYFNINIIIRCWNRLWSK